MFDNTATDSTSVLFRFKWRTPVVHTVKKLVPAGMIYRTWPHWATPGTRVQVGYYDKAHSRWVNLAMTIAVKGYYPECVYQKGWSTH